MISLTQPTRDSSRDAGSCRLGGLSHWLLGPTSHEFDFHGFTQGSGSGVWSRLPATFGSKLGPMLPFRHRMRYAGSDEGTFDLANEFNFFASFVELDLNYRLRSCHGIDRFRDRR